MGKKNGIPSLNLDDAALVALGVDKYNHFKDSLCSSNTKNQTTIELFNTLEKDFMSIENFYCNLKSIEKNKPPNNWGF